VAAQQGYGFAASLGAVEAMGAADSSLGLLQCSNFVLAMQLHYTTDMRMAITWLQHRSLTQQQLQVTPSPKMAAV
jgi:hypothetical protein